MDNKSDITFKIHAGVKLTKEQLKKSTNLVRTEGRVLLKGLGKLIKAQLEI